MFCACTRPRCLWHVRFFSNCLKLLNSILAVIYNLNKSSFNREPSDFFEVTHEDIKSASVLQVQSNAFFQQFELECLQRFG